MKKILFSFFAVICFCLSASAFNDTNFVVVRGTSHWAQQKKALSAEAAGKFRRAMPEGVSVRDITPDVYERYGMSYSQDGPTDTKILIYVRSLGIPESELKVTFVYDIYDLDGTTYVVVNALSPEGDVVLTASSHGVCNNFDQFIDVFAAATSSMIAKIQK